MTAPEAPRLPDRGHVTDVVVVDDHEIVRDGLRVVLGATPDFVCVGEARNGAEAIACARELRPTMMIMDLKMPQMDGITATREILADQPEILVVALTMDEEDTSVVRALDAGARGYLLKGATHDEIVQTLRTISAGGVVISAEVAASFFRRMSAGSPQVHAFPQLSQRESEVLHLLCAGLGDNRIGQRLGIEPKTVRNHVANIVGKTGARDRVEVVVRAKNAGFGSQPPQTGGSGPRG